MGPRVWVRLWVRLCNWRRKGWARGGEVQGAGVRGGGFCGEVASGGQEGRGEGRSRGVV